MKKVSIEDIFHNALKKAQSSTDFFETLKESIEEAIGDKVFRVEFESHDEENNLDPSYLVTKRSICSNYDTFIEKNEKDELKEFEICIPLGTGSHPILVCGHQIETSLSYKYYAKGSEAEAYDRTRYWTKSEDHKLYSNECKTYFLYPDKKEVE